MEKLKKQFPLASEFVTKLFELFAAGNNATLFESFKTYIQTQALEQEQNQELRTNCIKAVFAILGDAQFAVAQAGLLALDLLLTFASYVEQKHI